MEETGLALGLIAELRYQFQSMKIRCEAFQYGPEKLQDLEGKLELLSKHLEKCNKQVTEAPITLPADTWTIFRDWVASVNKSLMLCKNSLEEVRERLISETEDEHKGCITRRKTEAVRFMKAKSLSKNMEQISIVIEKSSERLLNLSGFLGMAIQMHTQKACDDLSAIYIRNSATPANIHSVELNYNAVDSTGTCLTPEAKLKKSLMASASSNILTAATGVSVGTLPPLHGMVGMAGVGKTVAMLGLATDSDIQNRFVDGIHLLSIGMQASSESVVKSIADILKLTGAKELAVKAEQCKSVCQAVKYAVQWFDGKNCLFLVDDVWRSEDCSSGFLPDLRQLTSSCSESRMVITTRDTAIAQEAGEVVLFDAREPTGPIAKSIFLMNAGVDHASTSPSSTTWEHNVGRVLKCCSGLPLALAVAGRAVALLSRSAGSVEKACEIFASRVESNKSQYLSSQNISGYQSLNAGIELSLSLLEREYNNYLEEHNHKRGYSMSFMYESLCVLKNQAWAPVSMLRRLWRLPNERTASYVLNLISGLSLGYDEYREAEDRKAGRQTWQRSDRTELGLRLHDLHTEYCRSRALLSRGEGKWHRLLLDGYLRPNIRHRALLCCLRSTKWSSGRHLLQDHVPAYMLLLPSPRQWWSGIIPSDGHIHENASIHLGSGGLHEELGALLLDVRWVQCRLKIGGILALKSDFDILIRFHEDCVSSSKSLPFSEKNIDGYRNIIKGLQCSWPVIAKDPKDFAFQMYGRLFNLRYSNAVVCKFLKSVRRYAYRPCMIPITPVLPDVRSSQILEIRCDGSCHYVAYSCCGQVIGACYENDIVLFDSTTGATQHRLKGHGGRVVSLFISVASSIVVSSSEDGSIRVWDISTSRTYNRELFRDIGQVHCVAGDPNGTVICFAPNDISVIYVWDAREYKFVRRLRGGHSASMTSLVFSPDGMWVSSGATDGTICLWDVQSGTLIKGPLIRHSDCVTCLSFSLDGFLIASGSDDHTVRLWNAKTAAQACEPFVGHKSSVKSISFSTDSTRIVSASADAAIYIWDAHTGTSVGCFIAGRSHGLKSISISPDSLRIVSGYEDRTICVWESQCKSLFDDSLTGHTKSVHCICFSPNGLILVSGSDDCTLRLWSTQTGSAATKPLIGHSRGVTCASFNPNGSLVVSGSEDGTVRLWKVQTGAVVGKPLTGHLAGITNVWFSDNDRYIVSHDSNSVISVWCTSSLSCLWRSDANASGMKNRLSHAEATKYTESGPSQSTSDHLFAYYPESGDVLHAESHYGTLPAGARIWKYNKKQSVLAAGFCDGRVMIVKMKEQPKKPPPKRRMRRIRVKNHFY